MRVGDRMQPSVNLVNFSIKIICIDWKCWLLWISVSCELDRTQYFYCIADACEIEEWFLQHTNELKKKKGKKKKNAAICYLVELFTYKVIDNFWHIFMRDHRPGKQNLRWYTVMLYFVKSWYGSREKKYEKALELIFYFLAVTLLSTLVCQEDVSHAFFFSEPSWWEVERMGRDWRCLHHCYAFLRATALSSPLCVGILNMFLSLFHFSKKKKFENQRTPFTVVKEEEIFLCPSRFFWLV